MAEHGIVGRGVMIDVVGYRAEVGRPLDPATPPAFTVEDIDAAAEAQGVAFEPGDIVLLRTGWLSYLLDHPEFHDAAADSYVLGRLGAVRGNRVRWLWEHRVSLLAADNLGVEVLPPVADSPFRTDPDLEELRGHHVGMAHPVIIALLGLPLGELWWLEDLAEDCRRDGCLGVSADGTSAECRRRRRRTGECDGNQVSAGVRDEQSHDKDTLFIRVMKWVSSTSVAAPPRGTRTDPVRASASAQQFARNCTRRFSRGSFRPGHRAGGAARSPGHRHRPCAAARCDGERPAAHLRPKFPKAVAWTNRSIWRVKVPMLPRWLRATYASRQSGRVRPATPATDGRCKRPRRRVCAPRLPSSESAWSASLRTTRGTRSPPTTRRLRRSDRDLHP